MPKVVEDGNTFQTNAYLKAYSLFKQLKKKHWVIADDSGLEVDYLYGGAGIYSARYAGTEASDSENVDKLLKNLEGISESERKASFRCIVLIDKDDGAYYFEGVAKDSWVKTKRGIWFWLRPNFPTRGTMILTTELGESIKSD